MGGLNFDAVVIADFDESLKSVSTSLLYTDVSPKPKGKNGFGYDPIFIPKNKRKTFGEMSSLQKYRIDHRFVAFKKIRKFL